MPRVSIITPTFNCAGFLGRAIESALAQTYTDYEVIVMDDGSTDETRDVVAQFDGRVRYFFQRNRGPSAARNSALSHANGELIAYLDADDTWYPDKLERQVAFLDAFQNCGLVHSDYGVIDATDRVIHHRINRETKRDVPQGHCAMDLLQRCHIQIATVMERRECLEGTAGFDERLTGHEDYCQFLLVAVSGMPLGYIDEPLAIYRRRADGLSSSTRRMSEEMVKMFGILLAEKSLGQKAIDIVEQRLYTLRRELAYSDRNEGRTGEARRRVMSLIHDSPLQPGLYVELFKACVPFPLAMKLRRMRETWS